MIFLTLAMLVSPVLAKNPAQIVPFTANQTPNTVLPPPGEDFRLWTTEGGTLHERNAPGAGTIELTFSSQTLTGSTSSIIDANVIANVGGPIKFAMTWTLDGGTFVGNINGKGVTQSTFIDLHGVLQGTGDYKGWTVILQGEKPDPGPTPFYWTGTIVIPS
jgi:hypothetical protein